VGARARLLELNGAPVDGPLDWFARAAAAGDGPAGDVPEAP
jgi:hypothetical protein